MSIHEMYGKLSEQLEATEEARHFLFVLVESVRTGEIKPEQIQLKEGGGFTVDPPETPDTEPVEE